MVMGLACGDSSSEVKVLNNPVSTDLPSYLKRIKEAHETKTNVAVSYKLRNSAFYQKVREILANGEIGELLTVDMTDNIGYGNYAHSFVRGPLRQTAETGPLILSECCEDMELLRSIINAPCTRLNSFGSLSVFTTERAPFGAAAYCMDGCGLQDTCPYNCEKVYITGAHGVLRDGNVFPMNEVCDGPTAEKLAETLENGRFGRCVYFCDNDVAERETVNMAFKNGVTATFTVSGLTASVYRSVKITGTGGELLGRLEKGLIVVRPLGGGEKVYDVRNESGADASEITIDEALESHVMALAADYSRLHNGETVDVNSFLKKAMAALNAEEKEARAKAAEAKAEEEKKAAKKTAGKTAVKKAAAGGKKTVKKAAGKAETKTVKKTETKKTK